MTVLESIDNKLANYFDLLVKGYDVSPAQRFRLEGYLQACVEQLLMDSAKLLELKLVYIAKTEQLTGLVYAPPSDVWALPYQVAIAPVNANG